jgi:Protein of unknown function (DUF4012)
VYTQATLASTRGFTDQTAAPAGPPGQRIRHRRRRSPLSTALTWTLIVAAGVGGALAGTHPTGTRVLDPLYAALLAALVTLAASQARRMTLLWLAFVAVAMSAEWILLPAVAALLVAFAATWLRRGHRAVGALGGALAIQAVLRWPTATWGHALFQGWTALVAVVAIAPVLVSAYRLQSRRVQRRILWGTGAVVVAAIVVSVPLAVAALQSRDDINRGIAATRGALTVATNGETSQAEHRLGSAATDFSLGSHRLGAWWTAGARLVPVVAQQRHALTEATDTARTLSTSVQHQATNIDFHQLAITQGQVDVSRLVAMASPLQAIDTQLTSADKTLGGLRSPWLVEPIGSRLGALNHDLIKAKGSDALAVEAIHDAPTLLGENRPQHYFVAFLNPAESRGLGGLLGGYGELTVDKGQVRLTSSGHVSALEPAAGKVWKITGPNDYLARYGAFNPGAHVQDLTYAPDLPTVAQVLREVSPQAGGGHINGVLTLDPQGLANLLRFTGPLTLPGAPYPLTYQNAASWLLRGQYTTFANTSEQARQDFLEEALVQAFTQLTTHALPNPITVAREVGPDVTQGHLLFWSFNHKVQPLLQRTGLAGAFPHANGGDLLAVTTQNVANNKLDAYLQRSIVDQVSWDPDNGRTDATVTITLHNEAPANLPANVAGSYPGSGLPMGTNRTWFSLYSPLRLRGATANGAALPVTSMPELGVTAYSAYINLPPGGTVTVIAQLRGQLWAGADYRLHLRTQPMALPDHDRVTVTPAGGWALTRPSQATWTPGDGLNETRRVAEVARSA